MREVETIELCKHPDCIYRGKFTPNIDCCEYILHEHHRRGCKISKCDKYRKGKKYVRSNKNYIDIGLEIFEGEDC